MRSTAAAIALALAPQAASADTLTKLDGPDGCVAAAVSSLPAGTCEAGRRVADATDIAISPDGRFLYAAATSSNSIAVFSRDPDSGKLDQLAGAAGCVADSAGPTTAARPPTGCRARAPWR